MSDSEDDIFSASTVPDDVLDSSLSIYEKETQALEDLSFENLGLNKDQSRVNVTSYRSDSKLELYDGPTQPLKPSSNTRSDQTRPQGNLSSRETGENSRDGDSDCDTIPASPRSCQDLLSEKVNLQNDDERPTSAQSSMSGDPTQPLPSHIKYGTSPPYRNVTPSSSASQGSPDFLTSSPPVLHLGSSTHKIGENNEERTGCDSLETSIYDGPTQPLHLSSRTKVNSTSGDQSDVQIDYSECDTLPLSPMYRHKMSVTPRCRASHTSDMDIEEDDVDEPTQLLRLPETEIGETGDSSVSTIPPDREKEFDSDCETLPSSPVNHLGIDVEEVPSTQSKESAEPIKASESWTALNQVDNWDSSAAVDSCPLSPALFSVSSPRPDPETAQNLTIHSENEAEYIDRRGSEQDVTARNDPTLEMDRETLPIDSPVFDFDESVVEDRDAITPDFGFHQSPPIVGETPCVAETPYVTSSPAISGTTFVAETPFVDVATIQKKRKIIRRSAQAETNSSTLHRTSTPEDMIIESSREEINVKSDTESSDFELSFASHYSGIPSMAGSSTSSSVEPFTGFETVEMQETSNRLQQIRQVIVNDQDNVKEQKPSQVTARFDGSPLPAPRPSDPAPTPGPSTSRADEIASSSAPRRSSRKPVPNARRTSDLFEVPKLDQVTRRRRGRPPKAGNTTLKVDVESSGTESDSCRKPANISLPILDPAGSEEQIATGRRNRTKRQYQRNEVAGPSVEPPAATETSSVESPVVVKKRGRPAKKEAADESLVENQSIIGVESPVVIKRRGRPPKKEPMNETLVENADKSTVDGTNRRTKRSTASSNNMDTSSIASGSPVVETLRRRKRALAGQVIRF